MHPLQKQDGCFGLSFGIACGLFERICWQSKYKSHTGPLRRTYHLINSLSDTECLM